MDVQFRILGPLEVVEDGAPLELGGGRQRALLAVLILHRGEVVPTDRLIDCLWGERPPATAVKTTQVYVSRLRKTLGDGLLVRRGSGYLLALGPDRLDVDRFEQLVSQARESREAGEPRRATQLLADALGLWRGAPLEEFAHEGFAQAEVARLQEARLAALGDRIDADLALGKHAQLVGELEALERKYPSSERFTGQLMLALYRAGRQADALGKYHGARKALIDELGIQPGRDLQELERAILTQDRSLDVPARPTGLHLPSRADRGSPGRVLIAVASALLLAVIAAVAVRLAGGGGARLTVAPNSLAVIDTRSNRVVAAIPVGIAPGPVAAGSGSVWVANVGDETISRIDPVALRTLRTLALRDVPTGLAASAHAVWAVQSNPHSSTVSVSRIDPQFDAVQGARRFGNIVVGYPGVVAARGSAVWIAPSSGLLTRVDERTGRVLQQIDPSAGPTGIDLDGDAVWVTDRDANTVTRVNSTGLVTPVAVGNGPKAVAVGAGSVWVADSLDGAVVRIDPSTASVVTTIPVGRSPSGIAVGAGSVWVANSGDGTITRIDPHTDKVTATIAVGDSPQAITIAEGRAWVTLDATTNTPSHPGGVLRIETLFDVDSMDPALAYAPESWQLLYATCAKLLNYPDRSGLAGAQLTPEVAQSLPVRSADGRSYKFTIRPGFRFSRPSNQAVTAQTFKATIERTLNPRMRTPIAYEFTDIVGAAAYMAGKASHISGLTARGRTLTVDLTAPEPSLPSRLAQPFFCAVPPDTPIDPSGVRMIPSAGPYYVESDTPGQGIVLLRNPNYRGSRPHRLERIEVTPGISSQRAVADIEAGTAEYTPVSGNPAATVTALESRLAAQYGPGSRAAARGTQQYFTSSQMELDYFALNTHRPLFASMRLRQAVNYAIDRRLLAKLSADQPTSQYLPPGMPGASSVQIYAADPDPVKARSLAHLSGKTAILYACNTSGCQQLAQIVKRDFIQIGLRVQIKLFPHATLYARIARPREPFDLALVNWVPDYPDPGAMLDAMLSNRSFYPTFDDPSYRRRLNALSRVSGPQRYLAYSKLAGDLARNAAPLLPYGDASAHEFFSARIGCQTYGFYFGVDLAALCDRPTPR